MFSLVFYLRFKHHKSLLLQPCYSMHSQNYRNECLPPSVVMSQNTFKELSFFSELIQYSPSPFESPASKMCLQDRAGWREDQPGTAANLNMFHFLVSWFRVNCQIISLWRMVVLSFYPFGAILVADGYPWWAEKFRYEGCEIFRAIYSCSQM